MKLITAMPEQQPRRPPREQSAPNTALPRPRWRRASIKWWCGRDVTMRAVVAGWLICLPSLPFIMYPPHGRSQHAGTLRRAFLSHVRSADGGPLDSAQMATVMRPVQKSSLSLCGSDVFLQKYPSQPPKCLLLYLRSEGPLRWFTFRAAETLVREYIIPVLTAQPFEAVQFYLFIRVGFHSLFG